VRLVHLAGLGVGQRPPGFELVLLDTGLVTELSAKITGFICDILPAVVFAQNENIGEAIVKVHAGRTSAFTDVPNFKREIGELVYSSLHDDNGVPENFASREEYLSSGLIEYTTRILTVFQKHGVRIDPEIYGVLTSFALLEGSMRDLTKHYKGEGQSVNALQNITPYALDLREKLRKRLSACRYWASHFAASWLGRGEMVECQ